MVSINDFKKFRTRLPNQKMPVSYLLAGKHVFEKQEMRGQEVKAAPFPDSASPAEHRQDPLQAGAGT